MQCCRGADSARSPAAHRLWPLGAELCRPADCFLYLIVAIWSGIGFLIFWRRPNDWFALFTALFLVIFNSTYPGFPITALALAYPALNIPIGILGALGVYSIIVFLVLFPNGRLVPRWMALVLVLGAFGAITTAFPNLQFSSNVPGWLDPLINIPQYLAIIGAQIYRYRKVSTPIERQQTKWVVFGIVIVMVGISLPIPILSAFIPAFNQSNIVASTFLGLVNYPVVLLVLPVTIGIAILRSRLYDIDVIINRTLVYGSLTTFLALVYIAGVVGAQAIVQRLHPATEQRAFAHPHRRDDTADRRAFPAVAPPPPTAYRPPLLSPQVRRHPDAERV